MSFVAVAIGGAAIAGLGGAYMQSQAARDAANTQAGAANQASAVQQHIYDQTRDDQAPWRQAGQQALGQMQDPNFQKDFSMSDFQADPGYGFRMQEGQKALERSAAGRGLLNSTGTLKDLTRYAQGVASDEYQNAYNRFNNDRTNRFNRLASLSGSGQTANATLATAGQNLGNELGQNITGAANANAAGQIGQANAWSGALTNGANSWMNYSMMNRMFPSQSAPAGGGAPMSTMNIPSVPAYQSKYFGTVGGE